uniref:ATP synthase complex subunit 8 n=1 Tax=Capros aper TaxID=206100 RepID=A4QIK3_9TELE|nr:ATP synthase F0 subunit 8 [Capros aper]BAF51716.1 ATPase subunit 8 [Capros aper]
MPHLDPNPWFFNFALMWLTFFVWVPLKVLDFTHPNKPAFLPAASVTPTTWTWPWY